VPNEMMGKDLAGKHKQKQIERIILIFNKVEFKARWAR
jgi:hypothetical protein